ncbi:tetraspanin-31-like isoform X1 [Liolophura sinensis]|uniref:tetraspanin-31-like isoform X1 n=1 Tax=Liolophura sinensis TaxID=3198878 RepID=UPI003157FEC8
MVCGGFSCSKNALVALNVLYIIVAFILIGVAAYGKAVAVVTSLALVGSIITCGVVLLFIAIIGLIGAVKHHQVMLFFYMIILFLLFLLQFALACACLAVNEDQQRNIVERGWNMSPNSMIAQVQTKLDCCGFQEIPKPGLSFVPCSESECCQGNMNTYCCSGNTSLPWTGTCDCANCWDELKPKINKAFKATGGVGLFFSFTEIIGVWLAMRYRNQKDPRANPSAFL